MEHVLYIILALVVFLGCLSRVSNMGWLYFIGIATIIFFTPIHINTHLAVIDSYERLIPLNFFFLVLSHLAYLSVFLFQADGGDEGSVVAINQIFPFTKKYKLEAKAFSIFIISMILHLIFSTILSLQLGLGIVWFSWSSLKIGLYLLLAFGIITMLLPPILEWGFNLGKWLWHLIKKRKN